MSNDLQKEKILFAAVEETVPGTSEAITTNDFVQLTEDGASMNSPREKVETNPLSGDRLKKSSKKTIQNGDGEVTAFFKAGEAVGDKSEMDLLLRSFGFSKEQVTTTTATTTLNTTTVLNITAGDESKYKVGQHILIGGKQIGLIKALASGSITLNSALDTAPADGAIIEKLCAYRLDDKADVYFTAYKLFDKIIQQSVPYCKTQTINLSDISSASVPKISSTFMGINFLEEDLGTELAVTPNFVDTEKPFALDACLIKDGEKTEASELSVTFEQTVARKRTLCAKNGNKSTRGTGKYTVSGSFTLYKKDDEVGDLPSDSKFTLAISMYVPGAVDGDKQNIVSIYIPNCKVDEIDSNNDIDGLVTSNVTFSCEPDSDETTYPVITFI